MRSESSEDWTTQTRTSALFTRYANLHIATVCADSPLPPTESLCGNFPKLLFFFSLCVKPRRSSRHHHPPVEAHSRDSSPNDLIWQPTITTTATETQKCQICWDGLKSDNVLLECLVFQARSKSGYKRGRTTKNKSVAVMSRPMDQNQQIGLKK